MRIKILLVTVIVLLLGVHQAHAAVSFSEIMYDLSGTDTDHEWVELYNDDSSTVDITGWKFNDGSNHVLNDPPTNGGQGSLEIGSGGYIVLAGDATTFLADNPGFSGTVIDTVMSLNNTSDTLSLYSESSELMASATYSSDLGAAGDGNSLNYVDSYWTPGSPTPDKENTTTGASSTNSNDIVSDADTASSMSDFVAPEYRAEIISKIIAPAGVPIPFTPLILDAGDNQINTGFFSWNLGDGTAVTSTRVDEFLHTFKNPGDYVVILDYRYPTSVKESDATDKLVIKIFDPKVAISDIEPDGTINISNNSSYDIDLSGWYINFADAKFIFPKNTFVLAAKSIGLSPENTMFPASLPTGQTITLFFPDGHTAGSYGSPIVSTSISHAPNLPTVQKIEASAITAPLANPIVAVSSFTTASSGLAGSVVPDEKTSHTLMYILLLIGIIVIAGGSVLYIRRTGSQEKTSLVSEAEGYTIREEN